jgi:toxin ParE1/3/4
LLYSSQQWGTAQQDAALQAFDRAFVSLREHPHIGRMRDDIAPGLRSFGVLEHTLYYRVTSGDTVTILRILHRTMDATQHVG